ncbi:MAG: hypothetical protein KDJ34_18090 [Candidatus Competibacteraceae bacterium]|nr:hypothetical protein [Candidatus Competibacteraceae bacterium]
MPTLLWQLRLGVQPNTPQLAAGSFTQVVSKRMVKKQQMQWSERGAHLLLQVRTRVLDDELEDVFRDWYPGFRPPDPRQTQLQEVRPPTF